MHYGGSIQETWDYMIIVGLLEIQTEDILDVILGYAEVDNYLKEGMDTIFPRW